MDKNERTQPNSGMNPEDQNLDENETVAPELSPGQWFKQHTFELLIAATVLILMYMYFGVTGLIAVGKVAVGLGFLIFIHELGHFLVAKWCGVYVEVFSIGFGPAIPGCSFKKGETLYKLAVFPLGGYVQMLGQVDLHEESDGSEDDPRSYKNKTVLQRMAIISAGVVMNAILAVICFVLVFQVSGKERRAAVVSRVDSGSPSFDEGIPSGAVIEEIGGVEDPYFKELMVAVIGSHGAELDVVYRVPGQKKPTRISMVPRKGKNDDRPFIGVSPSFRPTLEEKRFLGMEWNTPTLPNSKAAQAEPAFAFGDQIIATTDPDNPKQLLELPPDPRKPGSDQRDYFELARRLQLLAGQDVVFRVLRKDSEEQKPVDILVEPAYHHGLGAVMAMGEITALRRGSPADKAGLVKGMPGEAKDHEREGDVIVRVEAPDPDGGLRRFTTNLDAVDNPKAASDKQKMQLIMLDPLRLPDQLRQWANDMEKAGIPEAQWKVTLYVNRHNPLGNKRKTKKEFEEDVKEVLLWDKSRRFDRVEPYSKDSPEAIPELGFGYQVNTTVVSTESNFSEDEDSLRDKDIITEVRFHSIIDDEGTIKTGSWNELEPHQWAHAYWVLQSPNVDKVSLKVNRDGKDIELEMTPKTLNEWPMAERGIILARDVRIQKAEDLFDAVALGLRDTYNSVTEIFMVIQGMFTGGLAPNNIGGPVMIANVAYRYASIDFWEFVFLLGMISINLAVINMLPIPILDGGHMVFLLYELVRGKPASEQVRVGATYVGLLLIACLFVFVLYLDITRIFFP